MRSPEAESPEVGSPQRTLILGGARSGKSAFGENVIGPSATGSVNAVRYIATGRRDDTDLDWSARIDDHRRTRPSHWTTVEVSAADDLITALREPSTDIPTLVDDLGTWLTGAIDDVSAWESPRGTVSETVAALVDAVASYPGRLVLVTPEVGLGVVPQSRAGRLFRDEMGSLNADLAAVCDDVRLIVAGLSTRLK